MDDEITKKAQQQLDDLEYEDQPDVENEEGIGSKETSQSLPIQKWSMVKRPLMLSKFSEITITNHAFSKNVAFYSESYL